MFPVRLQFHLFRDASYDYDTTFQYVPSHHLWLVVSGDACRPVVGLHSKQLAWHTGRSYVWRARTPNPDVLAQKMKAPSAVL